MVCENSMRVGFIRGKTSFAVCNTCFPANRKAPNWSLYKGATKKRKTTTTKTAATKKKKKAAATSAKRQSKGTRKAYTPKKKDEEQKQNTLSDSQLLTALRVLQEQKKTGKTE
jgi:hypothetical protein